MSSSCDRPELRARGHGSVPPLGFCNILNIISHGDTLPHGIDQVMGHVGLALWDKLSQIAVPETYASLIAADPHIVPLMRATLAWVASSRPMWYV